MREIALAREKPQKSPAPLRAMIADGATQNRVLFFKRIEHRTLRDRTIDFKRHLAIDPGVHLQMRRQNHTDHVSV
jgi:hypothetical protein